MADPINPFDETAVAAHRAARAAEQQDKQRGVAEPVILTPEQTGAALFAKYAERGLDELAGFVSAIVDSFNIVATSMSQELDQPGTDDELRNPDFAVWCAAQGKALQNAGKGLYDNARLILWDAAGEIGVFTTPDGIRYEFKRGATSTRSVDYKALQTKYPDVYNAVVKVKEKPADAPGTLSL